MLDYINNKIRAKNDARNNFENVDKAIDFYNDTHPDAQ